MATTSEVLAASIIMTAIVALIGVNMFYVHTPRAIVNNPGSFVFQLSINCSTQTISSPDYSYQRIVQIYPQLTLYAKNTYVGPITIDKVLLVRGDNATPVNIQWTLPKGGYGIKQIGNISLPQPRYQAYVNPGDVWTFTGTNLQLVQSGVIAQYYKNGVKDVGVPYYYKDPFGANNQYTLYIPWNLMYAYIRGNGYAATSVTSNDTSSLFILSNFQPVSGGKNSIPYYFEVSTSSGSYGVYWQGNLSTGNYGIGLINQYEGSGNNLVQISGNIYYAYYLGNGQELLYVNNNTNPVLTGGGPSSVGYWSTYLGVAHKSAPVGTVNEVAGGNPPVVNFYDEAGYEDLYFTGFGAFSISSASFLDDALNLNTMQYTRYYIDFSNVWGIWGGYSIWAQYGPLDALDSVPYSMIYISSGYAQIINNGTVISTSTLSYNNPFAVYINRNPDEPQYLTVYLPYYSYYGQWSTSGSNLVYNGQYNYLGNYKYTLYLPPEPGAILYDIIIYNPIPNNPYEEFWNTNPFSGYNVYAYSPTYGNYTGDASWNNPYYQPTIIGVVYFPNGTWETFNYYEVANEVVYSDYSGSFGYATGYSNIASFLSTPAIGNNYIFQNWGYIGSAPENWTGGNGFTLNPFYPNSFYYPANVKPQVAPIQKQSYVASDVYYIGEFRNDTITIENLPPDYTIILSVPGSSATIISTGGTQVINLLKYFTAYQLIKAEENGGILMTVIPPPGDFMSEIPISEIVHVTGQDLNMMIPENEKIISACVPTVNSSSSDVTLVLKNMSGGYYVYIGDGNSLTPLGFYSAVSVQIYGNPFVISAKLISTNANGGYNFIEAGGSFNPLADVYTLQYGDTLYFPSNEVQVTAPAAVSASGNNYVVLVLDGEALTFPYQVSEINITGLFSANLYLVK